MDRRCLGWLRGAGSKKGWVGEEVETWGRWGGGRGGWGEGGGVWGGVCGGGLDVVQEKKLKVRRKGGRKFRRRERETGAGAE